MDDFNTMMEVGVLRRKLQSKAEALLILTQELDQCRSERDQLKLIADQTQNRSLLKKNLTEQVSIERLPGCSDSFARNGITTNHHLEDQKKTLQYEIQELKQKLREAYGDLKVLRAGAAESCRLSSAKEITPSHQREELVEQLERMGGRVIQLESDVRGLLDEKEELVTEREIYRGKIARLNHQLNMLLRGDMSSRLVDIDSLIMDNKYLQDQVQQLQAEKEFACQGLQKYKSMLDKRRNKGEVRLGSQTSTMVVTQKQVQELLEKGNPAQMPNTEASLSDMRSLCVALLEALQDKSLALTHQRRANKILANRVCDLEHRLGTGMTRLLVNCGDQHCELSSVSSDSVKEDVFEGSEDLKQELNDDNIDTETEPVTPEVCENDKDDNLPEDIQELVSKALKEIQEEESKSVKTN